MKEKTENILETNHILIKPKMYDVQTLQEWNNSIYIMLLEIK